MSILVSTANAGGKYGDFSMRIHCLNPFIYVTLSYDHSTADRLIFEKYHSPPRFWPYPLYKLPRSAPIFSSFNHLYAQLLQAIFIRNNYIKKGEKYKQYMISGINRQAHFKSSQKWEPYFLCYLSHGFFFLGESESSALACKYWRGTAS
jgi:hypothetical protein